MGKCIFCGKEITDFQEFEFCTTKYRRWNIYTFIHSDCMVIAQEWLRKHDGIIEDDKEFKNKVELAKIGAIYYADTDSVLGGVDDGK